MPKTLSLFIDAFRALRCAVVVDDVSTPERAALVMPAEDIDDTLVNQAIALSSGIIFVALSAHRTQAFNLPAMARPLRAIPPGAMTVSVEAREGVSTGISARDRAQTIKILGERAPLARKLVSPGHIFPLVAKDGGVLSCPAIPEAALTIVTRAGWSDAASFIDLVSEQGSYMTKGEVQEHPELSKIPQITISDLTRELLVEQTLVSRITEAHLPTERAGPMKAVVYRSRLHEGEHLALVKGDITSPEPVLTRVQGESTFSDVFGGSGHSREQLHRALTLIGNQGRGVLVYLRKTHAGYLKELIGSNEGSGYQKMNLMREYGVGAQILRDLGITRITLLTNSPKNLVGLDTFGISIVGQIPLRDTSPAESILHGN